MGEFELIRRFFDRAAPPAPGVALGIGDDCALLLPQPGQQLAVSTDMLVEGRHFLATVDPAALGHKALAVNLSDLAAMGAEPLGFTLALALPQADEAWLAGFAQGLFALSDAAGCPLVGGDTTRGPLNLCLTVMGQVPPGQALRRAAARAGDDIWVSGTLGDARLALEVFRGGATLDGAAFNRVRARMERPTPRLALGLALRGVAHAAADISDGLAGDLGHILNASGVGATLWAEALLHTTSTDLRGQGDSLALAYALTGGDDYELVFTAPVAQREAVAQAAARTGVAVTRVGQIEATPGLRVLDTQGRPMALQGRAFDHFA
ncbi:thiamine-phosphate kinase [Hydrogenophaga sp. OTU3427]|uniref:thiamine-phosphate kinase n=1 Tax=Hydrogenophaga sp. OTU3427 TaxID=3043856 RepID=UPI00313D0D62